jgi:hypothetical protein
MFAMALLADTVMQPGDSNMTCPVHCKLPETREVSELEEVPSPVTPKMFLLAMRRFDRKPKR